MTEDDKKPARPRTRTPSDPTVAAPGVPETKASEATRPAAPVAAPEAAIPAPPPSDIAPPPVMEAPGKRRPPQAPAPRSSVHACGLLEKSREERP